MHLTVKAFTIDPREISEDFVLSSGPGGQNVNKVSSAVQLRFDLRNSQSLPGHVKERLVRLAGKRINSDGELVIKAYNHRTQSQNRDEAYRKLAELIEQAATLPRPRRKTNPSRSSKARRLESKKARATIKAGRGKSVRCADEP